MRKFLKDNISKEISEEIDSPLEKIRRVLYDEVLNNNYDVRYLTRKLIEIRHMGLILSNVLKSFQTITDADLTEERVDAFKDNTNALVDYFGYRNDNVYTGNYKEDFIAVKKTLINLEIVYKDKVLEIIEDIISLFKETKAVFDNDIVEEAKKELSITTGKQIVINDYLYTYAQRLIGNISGDRVKDFYNLPEGFEPINEFADAMIDGLKSNANMEDVFENLSRLPMLAFWKNVCKELTEENTICTLYPNYSDRKLEIKAKGNFIYVDDEEIEKSYILKETKVPEDTILKLTLQKLNNLEFMERNLQSLGYKMDDIDFEEIDVNRIVQLLSSGLLLYVNAVEINIDTLLTYLNISKRIVEGNKEEKE